MQTHRQIMPARAKKKTIEPMPGYLVEQKIDGQRYLIHSQLTATSRRISTTTQRFVEKGDRVPHLLANSLPEGTVLDCEFVSSGDIVEVDLPGNLWDKCSVKWDSLPAYPHVSATTSIMGSEPGLAASKQLARGPIQAYCFDILWYNHKSTTHNSQIARRRFLSKLEFGCDDIILMPQWANLTWDEQLDLYERVTEVGGEGLIMKDPNLQYNAPSNWYKWKKSFPVDCVLTGGYSWGKGKLSNVIGALEIGVFKNNVLTPVGFISAIMDGEKNLTADISSLEGKVVECRHNGSQKKASAPLGFTLRHPRFAHWREDKNPEDCTLEALLCELN